MKETLKRIEDLVDLRIDMLEKDVENADLLIPEYEKGQPASAIYMRAIRRQKKNELVFLRPLLA